MVETRSDFLFSWLDYPQESRLLQTSHLNLLTQDLTVGPNLPFSPW